MPEPYYDLYKNTPCFTLFGLQLPHWQDTRAHIGLSYHDLYKNTLCFTLLGLRLPHWQDTRAHIGLSYHDLYKNTPCFTLLGLQLPYWQDTRAHIDLSKTSAWRRRFSNHENLTYQAHELTPEYILPELLLAAPWSAWRICRHDNRKENKEEKGVVMSWRSLHRGDSFWMHSGPESHHCRWQPGLLALFPA